MPDQEDELSQAEPDQAPDQDEDIQFIGFHGTSRLFAQDLVDGIFDNAHFGKVTRGGAAALQFGTGLYVVKASNESDMNHHKFFRLYPD
jgi:hypothetical protein